ncbi:MAG: SWIB-domain containing protein [Faunusvirus sp.]|jgi:chromatin remodeling complex protein RSC6|uniref:SWIB-domain containing protein n=1 Tax=Faunusvirus sp. TaxID=2487766 RepID=A0A3G4ZXQ7_9VIRU|nr:MAG: SWIB-domain containing protein [Faunusvirus sp.]
MQSQTTPAQTPVAQPAVAKPKAKKAKAADASAAPATPAVVVAAPASVQVPAQVAGASAATSATDDAKKAEVKEEEKYDDIQKRMAERQAQISALQKEQAKDQINSCKAHVREMKNAKKNKKTVTGDKKPKNLSGFNKPSAVPEKLAKFLKLAPGDTMARTAVTREIYKYVREHDLQNTVNPLTQKVDKRIIVPDQTLRDLLSLAPGENIEFKTFQTHVSKLYPKVAKPVVAAAPAVAATAAVAQVAPTPAASAPAKKSNKGAQKTA